MDNFLNKYKGKRHFVVKSDKPRFNKHFTFIGDFDTHYGLFDGCGKTCPFESNLLIKNNCC